MEAICKADYDRQVAEQEDARKKKEELGKELAESRKKDGVGEPSASTKALEEKAAAVVVPEVGFFACYGLWFMGELYSRLLEFARSRFGEEMGTWNHVYADAKPGAIADGVHAVSVYGWDCRLYKWTAQGFLRGLVVLPDNPIECAAAQVYMESGTWSWVLEDRDRRRLPREFCDWQVHSR